MKFFVAILFLCNLIVSLCSVLNSVDKKCLIGCPDNYDPVCGDNGMANLLFSNQCEMEVENCKLQLRSAPLYQETSMIFCSYDYKMTTPAAGVCPDVCPYIYSPICAKSGNDYKLYSNECEMIRTNCKQGENWEKSDVEECRKDAEEKRKRLMEEERNCLKPCTLDYMPVCGFDGKVFHTFGNKCDFENQHCRDYKEWSLVKLGEC